MKKILLILGLVAMAGTASAQFPTQDSLVKFINKWIRNSAVDAFTNLRLNTALLGMVAYADSAGIKKVEVSGSTLRIITVGKDTFAVTLPGGGGGGNTNSNIGSGFRLAVPNTNDIKTMFAGLNLLADSSSNTNAITFKMDTAGVSSYYLRRKDSTLYTTVSRLRDTAAAIRASATSGSVSSVGSGYGLSGGPITGAGTLVVDSATLSLVYIRRKDSTLYATRSYVDNFSPWPAQQQWGAIYAKSTWPNNAADFGLSGTAGITFSSGVPTITATTIDWGNNVYFLPQRPTMLNQWDFFTDIKLTFTPGAGTIGVGPIIRSNNGNVANSFKAYVNTSTSSNGALILATDGGTPVASTSGVTNTLNDVIRFWMTFSDSTITVRARNVTTGGSYVTATYNAPTTGLSGPFIPNTSNWGYVVHGTGTYQIQNAYISSTATRYANIAFVTDSKGISVGATTVGQSWTRTLGASYPQAIYFCDGGGQLKDAIARKEELFTADPQTVINSMGCNDKRYGATDQQVIDRMMTMDQWYAGHGIKAYWTIFPEDSTGASPGVGLTAIKNFMVSYFGARYVDCWTTLSTSNILKAGYQADKVHFNQAANKSVDSLFRLTGLLTTLDPTRRSALRTYSPVITPIGGDSLALAFKLERRKNYVLKAGDSLELRPGLITDNDQVVSISTNHSVLPTPVGGTLFHVNGLNSVSGNNGGFSALDRSGSGNQYTRYVSNSLDILLYNGVNVSYNGTQGQKWLGNAPSTPSMASMFTIKRDYTIAATLAETGSHFNLDTATNTVPSAGVARYVFASIAAPTLTSASAGSTTTATTFYVGGAPIQGTNQTLTNRYTIETGSGDTKFGGSLYEEAALAKVSTVSTTALGSTSGGSFNGFAKLLPTAADQLLAFHGGGNMNNSNTEIINGGIGLYSSAAHVASTSYPTYMDFFTMATTGLNRVMRMTTNIRVSIGNVTTPTARFHLPAGIATAQNAPMKLSAGTNMTTAEAGAVEYDGTSLFFSPSTTRLRHVLTDNSIPANGQIAVGNSVNYTNADIFPIVNVSATGTTTLAATAKITNIYVDATSGNVTVTVTPNHTGQMFNVKRTDASGNTVTVVMTSGNIDGAANTTIASLQNKQFQWNGTNTFIL